MQFINYTLTTWLWMSRGAESINTEIIFRLKSWRFQLSDTFDQNQANRDMRSCNLELVGHDLDYGSEFLCLLTDSLNLKSENAVLSDV